MQDETDLDDDQSFSMLCTQEVDEDIDVIWDWNSPQAKKISRVHIKKQRLYPSQSPKLTIRRHTSNTLIPRFDKLKEEVEALREELTGSNSKTDNGKKTFADLDDDSFDEQLILCSQRVENEFINKIKTNSSVERHDIYETCDKKNSSIDNLLHGTLQNTSVCKSPNTKIADDSFDLVIGNLMEDDFESTVLQQISKDINKEQIKFSKTDDFCNNNQYVFPTHSSCELPTNSSKGIFC